MRHFVLFFVLAALYTQAQVVIPDNVAKYFLKRNDVAEILEKRDSLHLILTESYKSEIVQKDKLIAICETESVALKDNIDFLQKESRNILQQNKTLTKLLAREQKKVRLCLVGMIILALL